jgi:hypothetical protein
LHAALGVAEGAKMPVKRALMCVLMAWACCSFATSNNPIKAGKATIEYREPGWGNGILLTLVLTDDLSHIKTFSLVQWKKQLTVPKCVIESLKYPLVNTAQLEVCIPDFTDVIIDLAEDDGTLPAPCKARQAIIRFKGDRFYQLRIISPSKDGPVETIKCNA